MIYTILVLLHVLVSFFLVVVILLQSSKGGGLAGSTFGGGASSFLGARGTANFLSRATAILAVVFMLNSLGLSLLLQGGGAPRSVTQQEMQQSGAQNLPRVSGEMNLGDLESSPGAPSEGQPQGAPDQQNPTLPEQP
jgi:preprotein translocase subunit SecG